MKRKMWAMILILGLILGLVPQAAIPVEAADDSSFGVMISDTEGNLNIGGSYWMYYEGNERDGQRMSSSNNFVNEGEDVYLRAEPKDGYRFAGWFQGEPDPSPGEKIYTGEPLATDYDYQFTAPIFLARPYVCAVFEKDSSAHYGDQVQIWVGNTDGRAGDSTVMGGKVAVKYTPSWDVWPEDIVARDGTDFVYGDILQFYKGDECTVYADPDDGYKFVGWYHVNIEWGPGEGKPYEGDIISTETSFTYKPGETVVEGDYEPLRYMCAVFEKSETCTVNFDPGTGTGDMETALVATGEEYELPECTFTHNDSKREFYKWLVNDELFNPGDAITVYADTTITAMWHYIVKKEVEIMTENGDKHNEEVSFKWNVETLEYRRDAYDYDLAIAAAYINHGTYRSDSENETKDRMSDLGFEHFDQNHPYNDWSIFEPWMAIGYQTCPVNGREKKIVCLNVRGTKHPLPDWTCLNIIQGWGSGFVSIGQRAFNFLSTYCETHSINLDDPDTILFMAGHSLGGAAISRLAIELNENNYQTKVIAYVYGTPSYSLGSSSPKGLHTVWNEGDIMASLGGIFTSHTGQLVKFRHYSRNYGQRGVNVTDHELDRYLYRTFHSAGKMSNLSANPLTYSFKNGSEDAICPVNTLEITNNLERADSNKLGTKYYYHCPVDVRVYNADNILVGDSTNDDFMFTDGSGGYIYLSDDEKYVFLPAGSNYRIDISGTDDGTMNVDVMEIDLFGEEINSVTYEDISIEDDKHFILDAQSVNTVDESDLFVVQDERVPVAFVQTDGTEVPLLGSGVLCEGITWSVDTTGELAISGSGGIPSYTDADAVPWAGLSDKITSVSIGDGITTVGAGVFAGLPDLRNATVATTVEQIGAKVFSGCTGLETVLFYGDMPAIDASAFEGLSLDILYYSENSTWEEKPDLGDGVAYSGYCGFTSEGLMMEHSFENETAGPDCTSFGYDLYRCTTCGYAYATDFVESPGHEWGKWEVVKDATEDAEGEEQRSCLRCHEKETRIINKLESITGCTVTLSPTSYTYDGSAKKPSVTVKNGTAVLILDTDYIVTYSGNKNAGTATATITGKGNYAGTVSKTFTINKAAARLEFAEADISKKTTDAAFTNSLTKTTDGTVTFKSSNTTVATVNSTSGQVTIKGIGSTTISANAAEGTNYKAGSANYKLTVTDGRTDITGCMITLSSSSYTYNGKERKPSVTVTDGTVTLTSGTDYTVSYSNNTNAGTATVTITGKGVYTGTSSTTFTIKKATAKLAFAEADISKKTTDATFTNTLTKTTDGTVTFSSSDMKVAEVNSTSGQVTIKGAGTATITATAAEGTNYKAGSASYTLTVEASAPTPAATGFSDVQDPSHPYYKAIYWAADKGITKGYSDGTFGINRSCTRGEMMMFLWRYAGKPAPKNVSKSPFKDVPKTHTFYKAILWGSQKGITKGYPDGTFGINRNVSRGECMMFLWRLKGKPAPKAVAKAPFPDVPKSHVFYNAVLWGYQKKITTGFTSGKLKGKFGVNENCSRGQIVTFLYRAK